MTDENPAAVTPVIGLACPASCTHSVHTYIRTCSMAMVDHTTSYSIVKTLSRNLCPLFKFMPVKNGQNKRIDSTKIYGMKLL